MDMKSSAWASHSFYLNSTRITDGSPLDYISVGAVVSFMLTVVNVKIKATNIYQLIDASLELKICELDRPNLSVLLLDLDGMGETWWIVSWHAKK